MGVYTGGIAVRELPTILPSLNAVVTISVTNYNLDFEASLKVDFNGEEQSLPVTFKENLPEKTPPNPIGAQMLICIGCAPMTITIGG